MNINEAVQYLNNTGKHRITKGSVFGDDTYCWQALSQDYKPGEPLTPRNSSLTLFFTADEIINMSEKEQSGLTLNSLL